MTTRNYKENKIIISL